MNEIKPLRNALIKLGICALFALCYCVGGMGFLWARRFVAPTILVAGMFYFSRDWRSLVQLPLMMFSLAIGYGGDTLIEKILKRTLFGFANGVSSSGYNIWHKKWLLVGTQIVLLVGLYVVMGVFNPLTDARTEELFLGIMIPLIPLFSVKDYNSLHTF